MYLEKVVKRTFGYGKPKENEDYTHVILTEDEHNNKNLKIRDLEENIKQLEKNYNTAIEKYKKSADNKIKELQAKADGRIAEVCAEMEEHKNKADNFENINKNLIRVATERANVKRGLSPKKEHIGYIFLSVEEFTYNCECYLSEDSQKTKVLKLPCYRLRLQSPYQISFDLPSVRILISNDFSNKRIYDLLGFNRSFDLENWTVKELTDLWNDEEEKNFSFKTAYKAQRGFWEIEFLTRFIINIPPEMTAKK